MYCVIGTGPTASTAAHALVKKGLPVCIVDPSVVPDRATDELRRRMAAAEPQDWDSSDLTDLKGSMRASSSGIPQKLVYGSDYLYRQISAGPQLTMTDADMLRSYARGGLSNVWGACVLPYPDAELADWPFPAADLHRHYQAVLEQMPFSGADDALSAVFPEAGSPTQSPIISKQCAAMLSDMDRRREKLADLGIQFGAARLAVDTTGKNWGERCRECGLCLYGCPYGLIYSANRTLDDLRGNELVEYKSGFWVHRLEQLDNGARVHARNMNNDEPVHFDVKKAFVGAGVVETTRIMLQSMDAYDRPLTGLHSDRFVLPVIRLSKSRGISADGLHTMAQIFLEISDPQICQEHIHIQIYGYNELFEQAIEEKLGLAKRILGPIAKSILLERMMVAFGYLHSNHSAKLEYTLSRNGNMSIRGLPNESASTLSRAVVRKLRAAGMSFNSLVGGASLASPGGGNHSGGCFPMREAPAEFESDPYGVPVGFRDIHIVDASVLPSLSSTTITLTAMANAHRIATLVA